MKSNTEYALAIVKAIPPLGLSLTPGQLKEIETIISYIKFDTLTHVSMRNDVALTGELHRLKEKIANSEL